MKLTFGKNVLLLALLVASVPRLALGYPTPHAINTIGSQPGHHLHDIFASGNDGLHEEDVFKRDEEDFDIQPAKQLARIAPRAAPPRIPLPPPLPQPRLPVGTPRVPGVPGVPGAPRPAVDPVEVPSVPGVPRPVTPPRPDLPAPASDFVRISDDINPGSGPGKGDPPKDMTIYESSGRTAIENLVRKTSSTDPDSRIVATDTELDPVNKLSTFRNVRTTPGYKVDDGAPFDFQSPLENGAYRDLLKSINSNDLGFSMNDVSAARRISITNINGEPINKGIYDPEGRFIMYQEADRSADLLPAKAGVPLNEMGMQNLLYVAGDKARNLKVMFLMDVQNKEFWGIVRENYNELKRPFEQVVVLERGSAGFNRVMGSPNFKSKIFSLGNHHGAVGNKVPDKVVIVPRQVTGMSELGVAVVLK